MPNDMTAAVTEGEKGGKRAAAKTPDIIPSKAYLSHTRKFQPRLEVLETRVLPVRFVYERLQGDSNLKGKGEEGEEGVEEEMGGLYGSYLDFKDGLEGGLPSTLNADGEEDMELNYGR